MPINANRKKAVPAMLAGLLTAGCVNADTPVENEEYRFKVSIPGEFPVCILDVLTHIHGVGTVLTGDDCGNRERGRAFNIWADYNTVFAENSLAYLRENPACSGASVEWADGEWADAISGLKTAMCSIEQPDGKIEITLVAQAGTWGKDFAEEAGKPHINYTVYFNSTKSRLEGDMQVFRDFLRSIEITQDAVTDP